MARDSKISHTGKVVEATSDFITVQIVSESACAACHASSLCSMSEAVEKTISVSTPAYEFYEIGEEVEVSLKASMGHKAVWIAYAIPLVVLMAAIGIASAAGAGELYCGLAGIGAVAVYYLLVYLFRDKLKDQYIFEISKINKR